MDVFLQGVAQPLDKGSWELAWGKMSTLGTASDRMQSQVRKILPRRMPTLEAQLRFASDEYVFAHRVVAWLTCCRAAAVLLLETDMQRMHRETPAQVT